MFYNSIVISLRSIITITVVEDYFSLIPISDFDDYFGSQSSILPNSGHSIFSVAVWISSRPASLILTSFILAFGDDSGKKRS
jgi:hypothetical protein